jgi:hypothetical protein
VVKHKGALPLHFALFERPEADAAMEHPVVFLCMNLLGTAFLYFGYDSLKKVVTGDSRTSREEVWLTYAPDLLGGLMCSFLGVCFWFGSFVWF